MNLLVNIIFWVSLLVIASILCNFVNVLITVYTYIHMILQQSSSSYIVLSGFIIFYRCRNTLSKWHN